MHIADAGLLGYLLDHGTCMQKVEMQPLGTRAIVEARGHFAGRPRRGQAP
ncbi:Uncharacterised protein [Bordetella pertussis]|nr:Uncharacterised protein [Bordetella pertussis]